MFLRKIVDFFSGYVIIALKGFYIERFINICVRRGIRIWNIKRQGKALATVHMSIRNFKRIRPVAKKTYTNLRIVGKCGLPVLLYRYRKRYVMFIGMAVFLVFMLVMSRFVWIVDVQGTTDIPDEVIINAAHEAGVFVGARKKSLKDIQQIRDVIINRVDGLAWAWVYVEGAKATVEVREKTLPPLIVDKNIPCDVVAMRDGLIKKITVKQGVTNLEAGDAVLAGEIIISGNVISKDMTGVRQVHALGTVEASTWHEKTGTYKLYDEIRIPTGKKKRLNTLNLFSKKFNLFLDKTIPYEDYDKTEKNRQLKLGENNYIGVGLDTVTYNEVTVTREDIPIETVIERAKNELESEIANELIAGAVLKDNKLEYKQLDDETIEVTVTMEFVEKIGTEKVINTDNSGG